MFNVGEEIKYDIERIEKYQTFKRAFLGKHDESEKLKRIFAKVPITGSFEASFWMVPYVIANFCGVISKISADFLFSEPPEYQALGGDIEQENLNRIVDSNQLNRKLRTNILSNSYKGDAFWKVRYDDRIIIEPVRPELVFVDLNPENIKEPLKYYIAFAIQLNGKDYLRVEEHEKGFVKNKFYKVMNGKIVEDLGIDFYNNLTGQNIVEEVYTNIDDFLIVHIPNFEIEDDFWGVSDYEDILPLQDEINNRLSRISMILDKHSDPWLVVPPGTLNEKGELNKSASGVFEIGQGELVPQYLTWDSSLTACFQEIDKLVDYLHIITEMSPTITGLDKAGYPESGEALQRRLLRTLAKIGRKRSYYDLGLKKLLRLAQELECEIERTNYKPFDVEILWDDGIPTFYTEKLNQLSKMRDDGAISLQKYIMEAFNCSEEEALDEIEKIKSENPIPRVEIPVKGGVEII
ncbi:MAG TPA: phage portal protein [Caldisericia bacterium]|nr:phage portal protein [Caldisericia bacterium]HQN48356.1 phage portal protein [Caldisericia bacterium]HQO99627.1 phage portal protein [Caldisericia bacterium]